MIRAPGAAANGRRTPALFEAVDLFPTVTDLATGETPPACPTTLQGSRSVRCCTAGKSARPLFSRDPNPAAWSSRAFSQVPRGALVNGEPGDVAGERYMGYTVRVQSWR